MIDDSPDNLNGFSLAGFRVSFVEGINHAVSDLLLVVEILSIYVKEFHVALLNVTPVIIETFSFVDGGSNALVLIGEMLIESRAEIGDVSSEALSVLQDGLSFSKDLHNLTVAQLQKTRLEGVEHGDVIL